MPRRAIVVRAWVALTLAACLFAPGNLAQARGIWSRLKGTTPRAQAPVQPTARALRLASTSKANKPAADSATAGAGETLPPADAARLASDWALAHGFDVAPGALEEPLLRDMADGRLDDLPLWDAALLASQVDDQAELDRYRATLDSWVERCRGDIDERATPLARATILFEYMHRELLGGGYQVDSTDFTLLVDCGQFNCVSSALLFGGLCERFSLTVSGVELPGHAYCVLSTGTRRVDVETTCPRWFAVLDDPRLQEQLVERTLGVTIDRRSVRQVPLAALVGTIYYNRGVDCLQKQQFAAALAANVKALRIDDRSAAAWGNLLASVNNWALAKAAAGENAGAVRLLEQATQLAPKHELFQANLLAIYQRWFDELVAQDRSEEAVQLVESAHRVDPAFSELASSVYRRHALSLAANERPGDALRVLAEARSRLGTRAELALTEQEIRSAGASSATAP